MGIPKNIKNSHIISAIQKFNEEGLPDAHADSTYYDLLYEERRYPPKVIFSFANLFANGELLDRNSFNGGEKSPCFQLLIKEGFVIVPKLKEKIKFDSQGISKAIAISERIMLNGLSKQSIRKGTQAHDSYTNEIKPLIDEYKKEFDGKSPNLFLKSILESIFDEFGFDDNFEIRNFKYWGRILQPYVWACISLKDRENRGNPASYSPQIYLLIDDSKIRFGLAYGDYIKHTDSVVSSVKTNDQLLKRMLSINQTYSILDFYTVENEGIINVIDDKLDVSSIDDLRKIWNSGMHLTGYLERDQISESSPLYITNSLTAIVPIFKRICDFKLTTESDAVETKQLDEYLDQYLKHCNTTSWLSDEKYKFNFVQWVSENIDFSNQSNEEVLNLARKSQEQVYYETSKVKGVNFVLTDKRFNDEFISLDDIVYLRALTDQSFKESEPPLPHDMTFPKVSVWASCFNPNNYIPYASSELVKGLAFLFGFSYQFPKKGYKAFQFAQEHLKVLQKTLSGSEALSDLFKGFLNQETLSEHNWAWITQDFNLFVTRVLVDQKDVSLESEYVEENKRMKGIGGIDNQNEEETPLKNYSISDATSDLFMPEEDFRQYLELLRIKKNIVLQGAPGVGKTFVAKRIAYALLGVKDDEKVEMIQFHQSYSYEDFIQGFRPNPDGGFSLSTGVFYDLCKRAEQSPESKFVLVVDEINRGNLSKIFGELLMLIESDKRGKEFELSLTYSPQEKFSVPENIYLIGTMNTADRSIAMVDYALRRRFSFLSLKPQFNKRFDSFLKSKGVKTSLRKTIINRISIINDEIKADKNNLGEGYQIGHSYFCPSTNTSNDSKWYNQIIQFEIEPLLNEYWFDEPERVEDLVENLIIID